MQAIADHVYHILIIAFVAATIVEAIVKFAKRPRKRGYRTLRVAGGLTFWLAGAGKSVF